MPMTFVTVYIFKIKIKSPWYYEDARGWFKKVQKVPVTFSKFTVTNLDHFAPGKFGKMPVTSQKCSWQVAKIKLAPANKVSQAKKNQCSQSITLPYNFPCNVSSLAFWTPRKLNYKPYCDGARNKNFPGGFFFSKTRGKKKNRKKASYLPMFSVDRHFPMW